MGLDSYASRTPGDVALSPEDEEEFATSGIELCGGLFSGGGGASFRGKVYLDIIDRVAGILIYQDWTTPEDVHRIWVALERADEEAVAEASKADHYPVTIEEVESLRGFFRICAKRGLGLIGWY